ALDRSRADADARKVRSAIEVLQLAPKRTDAVEIADVRNRLEAGAARNHLEPRTETGMAHLHASLAEMAVVEHDDGEIAGLLGRDRQEATEPHRLLAVAGDNSDRPLRLRQGEPKADHGRAAHRAPQIEIGIVLAGIEHVVG